MSGMNEFLVIVKKAALEVMNASNPVAVMFGTITSTEPLEINVEQKMTLTKAQLIPTMAFTTGEKNVRDGVILLRMQGGQKFIVVDRLGGQL